MRFSMKAVCVWTCLFIAWALSGCQLGPGKEITSTKPYADLIGAKYSVVADDLYAYGVYDSIDDRRLGYVALVPSPKMAGPEFAFSRIVPKGQVITILGAWRQSIPLQSGVYYLIAVENLDLPRGVPIRVELFRGNESVGADLNPAIYRRLPKGN